jgi:Phosphate-selective porin O and P
MSSAWWRWFGASCLAVAAAASPRFARAQTPAPPAASSPLPAAPPEATDAKPPAKTFIFAGVISQLDYQWHGGPGVPRFQRLSGIGLDNGFRMTRVGIRVGGRVESKWMFHAMAILGRSGADGQQRPSNNPTVEDAWTGYEAHDLLKVRIGQFQVPYTLDANEFYPPNADFLEPTMMTRFVTAPEIRPLGIMAWGSHPNFLYSVGYINAAGKVTLTGTGDLVARAAVRPFGSGPSFLQIGVGGRYGARDPSNVWYDQPSLQNGTFAYSFWSPVYVTDLASEYHIIPSNQQRTGGIELLGALGRVEVAAEGVLVHQERREAQRAFLDRTVRSGTLSGATYYVSLGAWLFGPPKRPAAARGIPYVPPKDPPPSPLEGITESPTSVQVVTRWEQLFLGYDSIARSPDVPRGALDFETRRIRVNAFQAILNVFVAKHVRLSLEYSSYITPGVPPKLLTSCSAESCPPVTGGATNQAIAPGAVQRGNITASTVEGNFQPPSPNAQTLQQIVTRVQVGF